MNIFSSIALITLMACMNGMAYAQAASKAIPLNQPLEVYLARFNVLADQMESPAKLTSKAGTKVTGPSATVTTVSLSKTTTVNLAVAPGSSTLIGVTLISVLDGTMETSVDAMQNMLLVPMAAFDRPKTLGIGDITTKLCTQAFEKKDTVYKKTVQGVDIGCIYAMKVLVVSIGQ